MAHVFRDLPGFVERTSDQEHRELVPAQPRDRVRIADAALEQRRNLAEQIVSDHMSATVVDSFEAIEIEVADHVTQMVASW